MGVPVPHPFHGAARRSLPLLVTLVLAGVVAFPTPAAAQAAPGATARDAWPASWTPPPTLPTQQEAARLPVLDDAGVVIPYGEIVARVDPSGARGAFIGGAIGVVVGAALGGLIAPNDCNKRVGNFHVYCSPREEALKAAIPGGLGIVLGVLGVWAGWESDRTTFDEAVEQIRAERRTGVGR